jgi:hypothetical protein
MNKKLKLFVVLLLVCLGLALVACAPRQATERSADIEGANILAMEIPSWSPESDCARCHTTEVQSADNAAATYAYHADQQGIQCVTCHANDSGALAEEHKDYAMADLPTELRNAVSSDGCLGGCHAIDDLKAQTASMTLLTDNKGTTVNPHDLPINDDHALVTCALCHEMHGDDPVDKTAPKVCLSCHHKGIYECESCH